MNIHLSETLSLPEKAVTETFAFIARRGAGKTYSALKLAEGMLDIGAQVVAFDPVGVWYSLRIAADGKGQGFDIPIFGGLHGDIPLEPAAGALIADLVVERNISAVLDVSMFRKNDRKRFATEFAEQLFHRKKTDRSPLHLFVEEAQVFVPQQASEKGGERDPKGGFFSQQRMLGAFEDLVKLGRNFGIGVTLISQRPQSVNKDALNQTEALFVLQINGPQERKTLKEWIVEQGIDNKGLVDELPSLPIGTAYLWSPSWLRKLEKVRIGKRTTYDASATPTIGTQKRAEPRPLSKDELAEVEQAMSATIERLKADDPKELRRQIADLKKQLEHRPVVETKVVHVEVPVLLPAVADRMRELAETIGAAIELFGSARPVGPEARTPRTFENLENPRKPAEPRAVPRSDGAAPTFRAGAIRMLRACAQFEARGLTRSQLVALAGVKAGPTFSTYISELRRAGYIEENGARIYVTAAGMAYLAPDVPHQPRSAEEILERWRGEFRAGCQRMLDLIVAAYPDSVSRADIARDSGIAAGPTFSTYLSELKRAELVNESKDGLYAVVLDLVAN